MRQIASAFDSATCSVWVHARDWSYTQYAAPHPDIPAEVGLEYAAHFAHNDPLRAAAERLGTFEVRTETQLVPADELKRLAVYNDFYLKWGWGRTLGCYIYRNDRESAVFGLQRPAKRPGYTRAEVRTLERVVPHMARAIEVSRRLEESDHARRVSEETLEMVGSGVVLLDERGEVAFMNNVARTIVAAGNGLKINGHQLDSVHTTDRAILKKMITDVLGANDAHRSGGGGLLIRRRHGRPLRLLISRADSPVGMGRKGAIVIINDPAEEARRLERRISEQHNLTASEARVGAALCEGYAPNDIARVTGVSVNTVRSHIKNIQAKLGAHTQAQIVAELLRGPGFIVRYRE